MSDSLRDRIAAVLYSKAMYYKPLLCVCGHEEERHERSTCMCAVIDPLCDCPGFKEGDDE